MTDIALRPVDRVREIQATIETERSRRRANRVLHGHPSPLLWLERDVPVATVMAERASSRTRVASALNLYVATPYCLPTQPDRCGFCLFPSEVYQGKDQLDRYLGYLQREGELYRPYMAGSPITSIYFGGGTSNLYKADQYPRLLGIVRGLFPVSPDAEVTLEGIPQLFTQEKLSAMRDAGVNRISIGVQQLADDLIALSGRKQNAAQVFRTLAWCRSLGLRSSVDLIYGWPRQTLSRMLDDLAAVVGLGVGHITHYELNVAGRTDFARHRRQELPSVEETIEMYHAGAKFLEGHGYRQVTTFDFERIEGEPAQLLYEDLWRHRFRRDDHGLIGSETWGWGFAGISHFLGTSECPGWTYMNHTRVDDYFAGIDAGRFPIERGFHYTPHDLRLTALFQMLQNITVDLDLYAGVFGRDLVAEYRPIWLALEERGWVRIEPPSLTLVGDGVYYTPLIQGLLAADRLEEMRRARVGRS